MTSRKPWESKRPTTNRSNLSTPTTAGGTDRGLVDSQNKNALTGMPTTTDRAQTSITTGGGDSLSSRHSPRGALTFDSDERAFGTPSSTSSALRRTEPRTPYMPRSTMAYGYGGPMGGMGMGMYGDPYGGAYGGGAYGYGGGGAYGYGGGGAYAHDVAPRAPPRTTLDRVQHSIQTIGYFTEFIAHLSQVLDSSWHAFHTSAASIARLGTGMASFQREIGTFFRAFTLARTVYALKGLLPSSWSARLGGVGASRHRSSVPPSVYVDDFVTKEQRRRRSLIFAIFAFVAVLGAPYFWRWLMRLLAKSRQRLRAEWGLSPLPLRAHPEASATVVEGAVGDDMSLQALLVVAKHNYTARHADELSFRRGDRLRVLEKPSENWWRCVHVQNENVHGGGDGGHTSIGLVPRTFINDLSMFELNRRRLN